MDEELLNKLIEIIGLEEDGLELFGYNSQIGLYDANEINIPLSKDFVSEFYVNDEYFTVFCNRELSEFLFKRITKEEFERLTLISNGFWSEN